MKKIQYVENRESQESDSDYGSGGYMPVHPGDILDGCWKVCRKLGFGHFSTVWLCKNIFNIEPKYVAIKICKSALMFAAVAQDEIRLLSHTKNMAPGHKGFSRIVQMIDTFKITAENGVHTAIALESMGPSLLHLIIQSEFRGIQVPGVKRIIHQVLEGLTYLHDECNIIHTDIKPENILIKVKDSYIEEMAERAERFQELGIPMPRSYVSSEKWIGPDDEEDLNDDICSQLEGQRSSSYPNDVYLADLVNFRQRHTEPRFRSPMWIGNSIEVKIADMGNACWENNHFSPEIQTRQYRALEVILQSGYSYPADIWSVGCLAFEMATGEMLFNPKGKSSHSINIDHLSLIWEVLGGIPRYITETGTEAKVYFVEGKLKHVPEDELKIWKIEDVLVEKYKWKRVDAIPFASFIECLIEPDPALRLTADIAMQNEWLNEV
ncbi:SRSF protein kinase 3 isoform X2 [Aethina tumida]|nr:SRSF protein kinase 3 isoform X2 [Aethina tumida]XP_049826807.1 SRSF protein kinase 3 isoform X2 [Aethina tumida]